jgi:hypothetical protein
VIWCPCSGNVGTVGPGEYGGGILLGDWIATGAFWISGDDALLLALLVLVEDDGIPSGGNSLTAPLYR